MPDQYGRLNLGEMRVYVLRNLAVYVPTAVDPTTGLESGTPLLGLNQQFSTQNINLRINSSTTKASLLVNANNETALAKEIFLDAVPGVTLYAVPPDMMQVRGLWWLTPGINPATAGPEDYNPMSLQDVVQDGDTLTGMNQSRPTWRLVGNNIQLNQDPGDYLNGLVQQGMWLRYIRWITFLANDTDYLDLPFAQVMQEVIVWDATVDLVKTQEEVVDLKGVMETLAYWNGQLEILVRNQVRPPEIRLIVPQMVKASWIGR